LPARPEPIEPVATTTAPVQPPEPENVMQAILADVPDITDRPMPEQPVTQEDNGAAPVQDIDSRFILPERAPVAPENPVKRCGRIDMALNSRRHTRIKVDTKIFIEVIARTANSEGLLLQSKVVDVSYSGLSVCIEIELTVGTILPVCTELPGVEEPFYLAAEVKWCRANEDGKTTWLAGLQILNSRDTDIMLWHSVLEHV